MKSKIISSILISSLLIQITLTGGGCMTFRPFDDNNLANLKKEKHTLLIKLKDKEEIELEPKNLIYYGDDSLLFYGKGDEFNLTDSAYLRERSFSGIISPAKIDSEQVIMFESTKYHFFWMKDKKRISIKDEDLTVLKSKTGNYYLIAYINGIGHRRIFTKDIEAIEEESFSTVGYISIIVATVATIVVLLVLSNRLNWSFPSSANF